MEAGQMIFEQINARLSEFSIRMDRGNGKVENLIGTVSAQTAGLSTLNNTVQNIEQKISNIEKEVNTRLVEIEKKVTRIETWGAVAAVFLPMIVTIVSNVVFGFFGKE
jgi:tetrahydromethanopterin S-methyltransferase subunit G